jgi:hypothetical protein
MLTSRLNSAVPRHPPQHCHPGATYVSRTRSSPTRSPSPSPPTPDDDDTSEKLPPDMGVGVAGFPLGGGAAHVARVRTAPRPARAGRGACRAANRGGVGAASGVGAVP